MASERELQRWIAESQRTRQRLKIAVIAMTVLSLVAALFDGTFGMIGLGLTALIAGAGFWIVHGHLTDWESQLARRGSRSSQPPSKRVSPVASSTTASPAASRSTAAP